MLTRQDKFKRQDASSYDQVARDFDHWTRVVTRPLAAHLVGIAQLTEGDRVLDVGTGSGVVAVEAAKPVGDSGSVLGIDLSQGMLNAAQSYAGSAGVGARIATRVMDAEVLELPSGSFDAVVSLFALLHFPTPSKALAEMVRVLRPGGRLVAGIGRGVTLSTVTWSVLGRRLREHVLVARGRLVLAPELLDRLIAKHLPRPAEHEATGSHTIASLPKLFQIAGLTDVHVEWRGETHVIDTADEFWNLQATFSSVARKRLSKASAMQIQALRGEFFEVCNKVQKAGGSMAYRNAALIVSGIRPL